MSTEKKVNSVDDIEEIKEDLSNVSKTRLICVVIGAFLMFGWGWGVFYAFGLYFKYIQNETNASFSDMGWMHSISASLAQFLSVPTSILNSKYISTQILIACSTLLIALGYFLTHYVEKIYEIWLFYGLFVGVGCGLGLLPAITIVKQYKYGKYYGVVNGIIQSGSGGVSLIMAPINVAIIHSFGWRNSLLYTSIAALISCIFMTIALKEPDYIIKKRNQIRNDRNEKHNSSNKNNYYNKLKYNRNLYCLCISMPLLFLGYWTIFVFIVPYSMHIGLSHYTAATYISLIGITNVCGRILCGFLSDIYGGKIVFIIAIIFKSILTFSFVWIQNKYYLGAISLLFGLFAGCISLLAKIISEYFASELFIIVLGIACTLCSFGTLVGPPIVGFLVDTTGDWYAPAIFSSSVIMLSFIPLCFLTKNNTSPQHLLVPLIVWEN